MDARDLIKGQVDMCSKLQPAMNDATSEPVHGGPSILVHIQVQGQAVIVSPPLLEQNGLRAQKRWIQRVNSRFPPFERGRLIF